jgi:hypothetical protein
VAVPSKVLVRLGNADPTEARARRDDHRTGNHRSPALLRGRVARAGRLTQGTLARPRPLHNRPRPPDAFPRSRRRWTVGSLPERETMASLVSRRGRGSRPPLGGSVLVLAHRSPRLPDFSSPLPATLDANASPLFEWKVNRRNRAVASGGPAGCQPVFGPRHRTRSPTTGNGSAARASERPRLRPTVSRTARGDRTRAPRMRRARRCREIGRRRDANGESPGRGCGSRQR